MGDPDVFAAAFDKTILHSLAGLEQRHGLCHLLRGSCCLRVFSSANLLFQVFEFLSQILDGPDDRIQKVFGLRCYELGGD
jgi:hypothetical protein